MDVRLIRFTLRRFLLAILVAAMLMALAGDANRRLKRIDVLFFSTASQTGADASAAQWHLLCAIADTAILVTGAVAIAMWVSLRLQD